MTAAHREASVVACPDCEAPAGTKCRWPDGKPRRIPCNNRMRAAERYDGAAPPGSANPDGFDRQAVTQLDSEPPQRDITEPLHPQEDTDA